MQVALEAFRERTGVDAGDDAHLAATMYGIRYALDHGSDDTQKPRGRGRPGMSSNLRTLLSALVKRFGPADAALALFIFALPAHPEFPMGGGKRLPEGEDVRRLLRRLEQRLDRIARAA